MDKSFWKGKRVLVTGHTGFKGSWLCLWLQKMGAVTIGYATPPPTTPSLFELADVANGMDSVIGDVRELSHLHNTVVESRPEIVIHMAAQPLVRYSYTNPVETYTTNVMGTIHLFEAIRQMEGVKVLINVTSDKCYSNREWDWGYRESDILGGHDPYSNSKACAELITTAYRHSFFTELPAVATVRAGNVIGGGDWGDDRLIPDIIRTTISGQAINIRNPDAVRPWQHVLEPLSGYLLLAERLWQDGARYTGAWNFGPNENDARTVLWLVKQVAALWGNDLRWEIDEGNHPHEATYLRLDCSKARNQLNWRPRWSLDQALEKTMHWYRSYHTGNDLRELVFEQIHAYETDRT